MNETPWPQSYTRKKRPAVRRFKLPMSMAPASPAPLSPPHAPAEADGRRYWRFHRLLTTVPGVDNAEQS
jgi:hypothetical protein